MLGPVLAVLALPSVSTAAPRFKRIDPPVIETFTVSGSHRREIITISASEASIGPVTVGTTPLRLSWQPPPEILTAGDPFPMEIRADAGDNVDQINSSSSQPWLAAEINGSGFFDWNQAPAFVGYQRQGFGSLHRLVKRPLSASFPAGDTPSVRIEFRAFRLDGPFFGGEKGARVRWNYERLDEEPKVLVPVLVVPGIAGSYHSILRDDATWINARGSTPWTLTIDPFAHVYDDLIQSLRDAGYVVGESLFIANYDWRMPPGPSDGTNDGVIQMTAAELTDGNYSFGVDYFAYWLKEAAEAWQKKYPDAGDLPGVNVISHSTGGLVVRSYQQNAARSAIYKTDGKGAHRLPAVRNSIMIAVPNGGASKIWNPWNDNWVSDSAYRLVLSKIVARGYKRILQNNPIEGPFPVDEITRDSVLDDAGSPSPVRFIRRYVPTIRSLLPTYAFLVTETDGPLETIPLEHANNLLIDLNTNMNLMFTGTGTINSVIYSTNQSTPVTAERRVGPVGWSDWDPISPMNDYKDRNAAEGEVWYEDIWVENGGDGTVPAISAFGTFSGEPRVKTHLITTGDTTHTGLCSNRTVQETVFRILGFDPVPPNISTVLATTENKLALSAGIDPVECLFTDAAGRRLGYTAATGVLTEIPGSVWLGEADGIALVYGQLSLPLSIRFNGLSEDYKVQFRLRQNGSEMEEEWSGFLNAGQSLTYTVDVPPLGPPRIGSILRLGDGTLRIGMEGSLEGTHPALEQSTDLGGPWSQATGAILDRIKGQSFITNPPLGATRNYYRVRFGP